MYKKQQGASFFSTLIVLIMAGSLFAIAFKLYSPYMNHATITSVIEGVTEDYDELRKPIKTIRGDIDKRFYINQVNLPEKDSLVIENDKGVLTFDLNYEVRVPMFYNVDAVVKFSESYEAVVP